MPLPPDQAWFPIKRYGWGWGAPKRWQGWAALAGFVGLLAGGMPLVASRSHPAYAIAYAWALAGLLIGLCWWKGEAPRWRWGGD